MTEQTVLLRAFDHAKLTGDGRTITGRVVPYNEPARVADDPNGPLYDEMFAPGSFKRAVRSTAAGRRVDLRYGHSDSVLEVIGPSIELQERNDGLWGSFRAMERSAAAEQALAMIEAELIDGFSVGFVPLRSLNGPRGVVVRAACHLDHVGLVRDPAYKGALIESVRSAPVEALSRELQALRPVPNKALDDRLAKLRGQ
jgi:HK97 family phage prohead protease